MQTAAMTSRFLTGFSSTAGFADSDRVVSNDDGLLRHIVASHLIRTVHSQELFVKLSNALINAAEQAYMLRDVDALREVSRALMNLPIDAARQIGLYYHALAINREGHRNKADALLETLVDSAPITYRARAIQTLGANHHDKGQLDEALRFQFEALRVASDKRAQGLQATLLAHLEIATVTSLKEDHKGALTVLERISPLVQIVSRLDPLYFYFYHNELAVEFGEVGRVNEAEAACAIALASPFAPAYPEWSATRDEIAAKRKAASRSVVAIHRAPEAELAPQAKSQRNAKPVVRFVPGYQASDKNFFQRSILTIPARATVAFNAVSILDRVLICIGPRAPPKLS